MEQIKKIDNDIRCSVVAVGNFDGVHRGHMVVFSKTKEIAATENLISVALTFSPHPRNFFDATHPVRLITDDSYKRELILSLGIEKVFFQPFDCGFASMNCAEFVSYLKQNFSCSVIVCGEGFRFGKNAAYGTDSLKNECISRGMRLEVVPVDRSFSSSAVRSLIEDGRVEDANHILGRHFSFSSEILGGRKLGTRIGFPTINQKLPSLSVIPKYGVYSGYVYIDGVRYKCIVNIGVRPTVNDDYNDIGAETHIFGFTGDLYGRTLRIFICSFVREERKFDNVAELKEQIKNDCLFVIDKEY